MRIRGLAALAILVFLLTAAPASAQQPTHKPGGYHSPEIQQGQSWSHVFNVTGPSEYHCHPHPFMQGRVDVRDGASKDPVTVEIRGFKFVPDEIVVGLGTNVTWINRDASFHTIDESLIVADADGSAGKSPGAGLPVLVVLLLVLVVFRRHQATRHK